MELTALLIFAGIYAVAVASPGPGVAAVVARALGTGTRRTLPFIAGIVLGDLTWFALVMGGLAVLAQSFQIVFTVIKYAGAAYLLYMAWKLWRAPAQGIAEQPQIKGEGFKLVLGGLGLTLGNPKTMVFFLAILPQIIALRTMTPLAIAELCLVMVVVLGGIMTGYALLAAGARRFIATPDRMRAVNRATGGVMAGVAVAVAAR
ncbi:lysine transporter LysE [Niveispirillum lacus]|uniref:Lysine transporter LysE n=1 Tax=Niveispirillum lacus TaxID=1981099 RepID=A0A255YWM0_9PROT|nr:LysE family translocator [Niveispirillum lacus]OYQ33579.1 lysine transporter LysE [Niveispirillum lacus]